MQDSSSDLLDGFYTDLHVGEILRRARMQAGFGIEHVEAVLRIRGTHLTYLEKNEFHHLPGRVYVIGFVRTYAEFLGLDGEKMVTLLKRQFLGRNFYPNYNFPIVLSDSHLPTFYTLMGSVCLVFLYLFLGHASSQGSYAEALVPAVPAELQAEVQAAEDLKTPAVGSEQNEAASEVPPQSYLPVIVRAHQDSWLEIQNGNGQIVFSQILREGQELHIPNEPGYVMTTGNAGGVDILLGDDVQPALGAEGEVRRGISLDPRVFKDVP